MWNWLGGWWTWVIIGVIAILAVTVATGISASA